MKIKFLLYLVFLVASSLLSCSDRKGGIFELNTNPEIFLVKGTNQKIVTDSVRLYEGFNNYYNLKLSMTDIDLNQWKVFYTIDTGSAKVFYNGQELSLPSIRADAKEVEMSVSPEKLGLNVVGFTIEDRFGRTDKALLRLYTFDNLPPVGSLEYTTVSARLFEFDASKSYDQDRNYDGRVVRYRYIIEGTEFTTSSPIIRHTFAEPGSYLVNLIVIDNSGASSPAVTIRINVS